MALALSASGAKIALVARDIQRLEAVRDTIRAAGGIAEVFSGDVTKEADVAAVAAGVAAKFGHPHILINNAGTNIRKNLVDFTLDEFRSVLDSSIISTFLMCRAFVPGMKGTDYGRIINLTSIMSHISLPGRTAYSSAKTGLLGLTRALSQELALNGITVNGISPGPFGTEMNTQLMNDPVLNAQFLSKIPAGRWGKVEEIGQLALFLCSDAAGFITGTDILIDGGWVAQ